MVSGADLSSLLSFLLSYVLLYKYLALFLIEFLAAIILPLPASATALAVGAFSSQGYLSFWGSIAAAVSGNVLGDILDYILTWRYGDAILRFFRANKSKFLNQLKLELQTDAAVTVFSTRFAGSLGPVVNLLSGLVKVRPKTFIFYDFLGNFLEIFAIIFIGYIAGGLWSEFSGIVSIVTGIIAVSVMMYILWKIYSRMAKKYSRE
jgi:undecaprenyl-diphosphatase